MMTQPKYIFAFLLSLSLMACQQKANEKLTVSPLFSDHMVLQQNDDVSLWGTYSPNGYVEINTNWGFNVGSKADDKGKWEMKLVTPAAGGPFSISIIARDTTIIIDDVLIGEVWLASGQSNMEMPLKGWPPNDTIFNSNEEIEKADFPSIRMFTVERNMSEKPLEQVKGNWQVASPETAGDFSATAYFFAKKLYDEMNVPIGIIHTSWGGTVAEAWTSQEKLKILGDFDEVLDRLLDSTSFDLTNEWFNQNQSVAKLSSPAERENFELSIDAAGVNFDDSAWPSISLPGRFDELSSGAFDGAVWLRKSFELKKSSSEYDLYIGAVDDMDDIYINGTRVGGFNSPGFYNVPRAVKINKDLLINGTNVIAIRALDTGGPGQITGPITMTDDSGERMSLAGEWKYRLLAEIYQGALHVYDLNLDLSKRPEIVEFHPNLPSVLYNGMIEPLIPYTIKGAIWYQGESNVGRANQYERLFPAMITDWRERWNQDFSFYYVQLAPFIYTSVVKDQVSAELRNAQRLSLKTPKTGMVVTLDVGNPTNIHPAKKQEVGERLALHALANDYGKDLVSSGPLFKNITLMNDRVVLEFESIGSGLMAKGKLIGFEIAGADKVFYDAQARIIENKVELVSSKVNQPKYARYAWRDDSDATLFNKEGLPASTFTTKEN